MNATESGRKEEVGVWSVCEISSEGLLGTLSDERSQRILAMTAREPLTVKEISEECDLPRSTVYRRVKSLAENGPLEENCRYYDSGNHSKEYELCCDSNSKTIEVGGVIEVEISYETQESDGSGEKRREVPEEIAPAPQLSH